LIFFNPRSVILFDYRHIDITGLFRILQRGCMAQMAQW